MNGVLEDVQDFARRRPGAFLMGAALVGFTGGRLLRSSDGDGDGAEPADDVPPSPPRRAARATMSSRRNSASMGGE